MENDYLMLSGAINSAKSTQVALNSLRLGEAGLNAHRQNLLNRAPVTDSFASFPRDSIEIEDLAYLSAHEDREFLRRIGQKSSVIISWYTGNMMKFYADPFEELFN